MNLTLAFIAGLGSPADGVLDGFRTFGNAMAEKYGITFLPFSYADQYLVREMSMIPDKLIVACHSNGGDAWAMDVDQWFARTGRKVEAVCMMDAKPRWNSWASFSRWFKKYKYPTPMSVSPVFGHIQAFYGGFGCPYMNDVASQKLDIDHADFPGNKVVQSWIENAIMEAVK